MEPVDGSDSPEKLGATKLKLPQRTGLKEDERLKYS